MTNVTEFLTAVAVDEPLAFKNLTVFPLIMPASSEPSYIALDEALGVAPVPSPS